VGEYAQYINSRDRVWWRHYYNGMANHATNLLGRELTFSEHKSLVRHMWWRKANGMIGSYTVAALMWKITRHERQSAASEPR